MSYNWEPPYIVPSKVLERHSGNVLLREDLTRTC